MTEIVFRSDMDVELVDSMGSDLSIAQAAWVSTQGSGAQGVGAEADEERVRGLIKFLMRGRHSSPFEHNSMTFLVRAPIFVWREHHRHRIGFCLSGDTIINPAGTTGGRTQRRLKDLHDRWKYGVPKAQGEGLRQLPSTHHFKIASLDEDTNEIFYQRAADVWESGVKELIQLDYHVGRRGGALPLKCTRDHQVLTPDGWAKAGELRKGDAIIVGDVVADPRKEFMVPSLRAGINNWTFAMKPRVIETYGNECYLCHITFDPDHLGVDHVVPVAKNLARALDFKNLRPVCKPCHLEKTATEQVLADRRQRYGGKPSLLRSTPAVVSEEMTYDIAVPGPWHNFLANGAVVHNSYNEESGRYSQLRPEFYVPGDERGIKQVGKPGAYEYVPDAEKAAQVRDVLRYASREAYLMYESMLRSGVAREVARMCLPVNIYSSCFVTMNARSMMHFLSLRTKREGSMFPSFPQREIEIVAEKYEAEFAKLFPMTYEAFCEFGRAGG